MSIQTVGANVDDQSESDQVVNSDVEQTRSPLGLHAGYVVLNELCVTTSILEYGVALLMNLCLRTNGRKKCAEVAEQAINALAALLNHPNHEVSVASSIPCLARLYDLFVIRRVSA